MTTSFYSEEELKTIGFKTIGSNVFISKKASIYGAGEMVIGSNVRVDDFCILSGKITLGNYIHISAYSALFGGDAGILMEDFSGISSRCVVYAKNDDYSGEYLTNPTVPEEYLGVYSKIVVLHKHVLIGSGTTILPGVSIGTGTVVGSMSLVKKSLDEWGIYAGIPCKRKKERCKNLLRLEQKMQEDGLL